MALHSNLLKHNILRVSKLKKLSHTTQSIERNFDRNVPLCSLHVKNVAEDESKPASSDRQYTDLWTVLSLAAVPALRSSSPQCGQQQPSSPDSSPLQALASQTLPALTCQDKMLALTARPNLDLVMSDKLKDRENSLMAMLFPRDYLPLIVKPVSYTTDVILACPADEKGWLENGIISYEKHAVTMLTECQDSVWRGLSLHTGLENKNCHQHTSDAGPMPSKPVTKRVRQHICDLSPPACEAQQTDSHTLLCSAGSDSNTVLCSATSGGSAGKKRKGPTLDQLRAAETYFIEKLPNFFKEKMDDRIYHPDVVFENNFWGTNEVSVGLSRYAMQMVKLRTLVHLKYAHVHMEVITSSCKVEEGTVRIQWRLVGLSQFKALRFWKYLRGYRKSLGEDAEWLGGMSILHINKDGLVTKHRMDRMTPDEDQAVKVPSLAVKLALLLGLAAPKPGLFDYSSFLSHH